MSTSRRRFLQSSALAATAVSVAPLAASARPASSAPSDDPRMLYFDQFYFQEKPIFRFEYPFDGGVLQEGTGYPILGTETGADGVKRLRIHVVVRPGQVRDLQVFDPEGTVIPMEPVAGALMGSALLKDRLSILKARGTSNGKPVEFTCRVLWAKNAYKRYRCYIDDHSFCFRDILQAQYKSIFDCFYFAKLRELHTRYQTKIVLNCFNSTPERDFTLAMFPDKYKPEFEDNAHWLRLAFHSENEFPAEPYRHAAPEALAADFDLTATQLKRIAGNAYTAGLQIHFAMVRPDSYQVLADRGVTMLPTSGAKNPGTGDKYCDFMLPNHITAYLREHQGWMDPDSGIVFYNGAMPTTCEWIPTTQTEWIHHRKLDNPRQNLLINIAGHEQYWWPFYVNYKSDIFERWDTALRHVTEHGYKPIWIDDGFFGGCD